MIPENPTEKAGRFVLDSFAFNLTFEQLLEKLKLTDEDDVELMLPLFETARQLAKPKALYRECAVDSVQGDEVVLDGVRFESERLAKNLGGLQRVFAFVVTCGTEADDWSHQEQDYIVALWLDIMKEMILRDASNQFLAALREKYALERLYTMNPGSGNVDVWPIRQQEPLFRLIGDVEKDAGVRLSDSMLMIPSKSVSGVAFTSDKEYSNCAYCTRENCVSRRTPYLGDM